MDKKVLLIISFRDFQDEEYFNSKDVFEKHGFSVKTASTKKGIAIGSYGEEATIDLSQEEIKVKCFSSIVFIGGQGALKYLDNDNFYKIIKDANENKVIIGAICIAPIILANANILKNKEATVWSAPNQKKPINILKDRGAIYAEKDVVVCENIVTENGPRATCIVNTQG